MTACAMTEPPLLCLMGPTAAGKSALAGFTSSLQGQRRKRIDLTTGDRVRGTWPVMHGNVLLVNTAGENGVITSEWPRSSGQASCGEIL